MMLEMEKEGKREREKKSGKSTKQSALTVDTLQLLQLQCGPIWPFIYSASFCFIFFEFCFFTFKLSCPPLSGNSEDIRNNIDDTMMMYEIPSGTDQKREKAC